MSRREFPRPKALTHVFHWGCCPFFFITHTHAQTLCSWRSRAHFFKPSTRCVDGRGGYSKQFSSWKPNSGLRGVLHDSVPRCPRQLRLVAESRWFRIRNRRHFAWRRSTWYNIPRLLRWWGVRAVNLYAFGCVRNWRRLPCDAGVKFTQWPQYLHHAFIIRLRYVHSEINAHIFWYFVKCVQVVSDG